MLYALGAVLPIVGIGLAIGRVSRPARQHRHRASYIQRLCKEVFDRQEAAATDDERAQVEEWRQQEFAKTDKWGKPYGQSDDGLSTRNRGAEASAELNKLLRDAGLIGGGLVAGTAASISSLWL